jgi:hypothetical protein
VIVVLPTGGRATPNPCTAHFVVQSSVGAVVEKLRNIGTVREVSWELDDGHVYVGHSLDETPSQYYSTVSAEDLVRAPGTPVTLCSLASKVDHKEHYSLTLPRYKNVITVIRRQ